MCACVCVCVCVWEEEEESRSDCICLEPKPVNGKEIFHLAYGRRKCKLARFFRATQADESGKGRVLAGVKRLRWSPSSPPAERVLIYEGGRRLGGEKGIDSLLWTQRELDLEFTHTERERERASGDGRHAIN